ncbi:MAG: hypothetical protein HQL31_10330, partial [Planctomycetes bacterium]|nr:hypothetical protein [Planctomycetota bacterium]
MSKFLRFPVKTQYVPTVLWELLFLVFLMTLGSLGLANAEGGDTGIYGMGSRHWLPYEGDKDTIGLFHLDKSAPVDEKKLEEDLERILSNANKGEVISFAEIAGEGTRNNVEDSSILQKRNALLEGDFEWLKTARLGGGVRLGAGKTCFKTPVYSALTELNSFVVEAWFNPASDDEAFLFVLPSRAKTAKPVFSVLRTSGGGLEIVLLGKSIWRSEGPLLEKGSWRHVSVSLLTRRSIEVNYQQLTLPAEMVIRIDGVVTGNYESPDCDKMRSLLGGEVLVGSAIGGGRQFIGMVDELRVSSCERYYYELDTLTPDPNASRVLVEGPPFLRDIKDQRLYISFDEKLPPSKNGEFGVNPTLVPGLRGKALLVGPGRETSVFPAANVFASQEGSLEFWFQPQSWENRELGGVEGRKKYIPLLNVSVLKKDGKVGTFLSFVFNQLPGKALTLLPGSGHHVVCIWREKSKIIGREEPWEPQREIYIDGKRDSGTAGLSVTPLLDGEVLDRIRFVTSVGAADEDSEVEETLIDELRCYAWALTPPEIQNAYQRYLPEPKLDSLPFAHVNFAINVPERFLQVIASLLDPRRGLIHSIRAQMTTPEGRRLPTEALMFEPQSERVAVRTSGLPQLNYGLHKLELEFLDASGGVVDRMTVDRNHVKPAWVGNRLGIHENEVLPGWENMRASEDGRVSLVGREILFGGDGWPQSMFSKGADMLARPIEIVLRSGGGRISLKPAAKPTFLDVKNTHVYTEGTLTGGGWKLTTSANTEYDGMMRIETTLNGPASPGGDTIDEFRIDIPLSTAHALFLGFWTGGHNFRATTSYRLLPEGQGAIFESKTPGRPGNAGLVGSFLPYVFLGDDARGLAWFAENDRGWNKSAPPPPRPQVGRNKPLPPEYVKEHDEWAKASTSAIQVLRERGETI